MERERMPGLAAQRLCLPDPDRLLPLGVHLYRADLRRLAANTFAAAISAIELLQSVCRRPRLPDLPGRPGRVHVRRLGVSVRLRLHRLLRSRKSATVATYAATRLPIRRVPVAGRQHRDGRLCLYERRTLHGKWMLQLPRRACQVPWQPDHVR